LKNLKRPKLKNLLKKTLAKFARLKEEKLCISKFCAPSVISRAALTVSGPKRRETGSLSENGSVITVNPRLHLQLSE
jgi:hypothetical protein